VCEYLPPNTEYACPSSKLDVKIRKILKGRLKNQNIFVKCKFFFPKRNQKYSYITLISRVNRWGTRGFIQIQAIYYFNVSDGVFLGGRAPVCETA
jgi:hypothetical protein